MSQGFSRDPVTDRDAVHTTEAAEISTLTEKTTPVNADLIIIEDSAAGNAKKKVQVGNLPGSTGTDPDAIHDNQAGEISAITTKGTPVSADYLLIEDTAAGNAKKKITIGSLPGGASSNSASAYVIAASNSAQHWKDNSDETLDGANDHVQINSALTNYLHVHLAPGTYDIGSPIEMPTNSWLRGSGYGTILKANGITTGDRAVVVSKSNTARTNTISDLTIDGNYVQCHGIRYRNTGQDAGEPQVGGDNYSIIRDVFIDACKGGTQEWCGIKLESSSSNQRSNYLHNITVRESGLASVHITGSSDNTLTNIHGGSSVTYGFYIQGGNNRITACKNFYSESHAFYVTSGSNSLTGCEAQDMLGDGLRITGSDTVVTGFLAEANNVGQNALAGLYLAASDCVITGFKAVIGGATMDYGVRFISGTSNFVEGWVDSGMDVSQTSGTPGSNSHVVLVRKGTSVYTFP